MARRCAQPRVTGPLLVLALAACAATPASAATQIGATPTPDQSCSTNTTVVQDVTAANSPSYAVPAGGGVITGWSYLAAQTPSSRKLKVLRPTATAGQYLVVGESAAEHPTAGQPNSFKTRIPVSGGDLLGLYMDTGDGCRASGASGNTVRGGAGDPQPGTTFSGSSLFASSTLIDVAATVEADGDGDGYGDETQDGCPGDASVYATPCAADVQVTMSANPSKVKLGNSVAYTINVQNLGPTTAHDVMLIDTLPERAPLVYAPTGCTGLTKVTCKLGDIAPGAAAAATTIVMRAPDPGTLTNTVTVTSPTLDPAADNNTASASALVTPPPFAGVSLAGSRVRATRTKAPVRVACPISARSCSGKLRLTTAKRIGVTRRGSRVRFTLAKVPFKLAGGHHATLKVPLSGRGKRVLGRLPRVATVATISATDAFSQTVKRHKSITVLPPR